MRPTTPGPSSWACEARSPGRRPGPRKGPSARPELSGGWFQLEPTHYSFRFCACGWWQRWGECWPAAAMPGPGRSGVRVVDTAVLRLRRSGLPSFVSGRPQSALPQHSPSSQAATDTPLPPRARARHGEGTGELTAARKWARRPARGALRQGVDSLWSSVPIRWTAPGGADGGSRRSYSSKVQGRADGGDSC